MFYRIKKWLRTGRLTKKLYLKLYSVKRRREKEKTRKQVQKSGVDAVREIQRLFESQNKFFFFDMGTLLGMVREGRLLKHDLDIDTALFVSGDGEIEEVKTQLEKAGCKHRFRYVTDGIGITEDSYEIKNIKFDINYYFDGGEYSLCYLGYRKEGNEEKDILNTVELKCKKIAKTELLEFEGFKVNVPEDPEGYLAQRYGENWRVPDKSYVYYKGPSTTPIENKVKKIEYR